MAGGSGTEEGHFDKLGGLMSFKSSLMFLNVFVEASLQIMVGRNVYGVGMVKV